MKKQKIHRAQFYFSLGPYEKVDSGNFSPTARAGQEHPIPNGKVRTPQCSSLVGEKVCLGLALSHQSSGFGTAGNCCEKRSEMIAVT